MSGPRHLPLCSFWLVGFIFIPLWILPYVTTSSEGLLLEASEGLVLEARLARPTELVTALNNLSKQLPGAHNILKSPHTHAAVGNEYGLKAH